MWIIISGVIGVIGFVISLINALYFFYIRKRKIKITITKHGLRKFANKKDYLFVYFEFDNLSQLPISITKIKFTKSGDYFIYDSIPRVVEEFERRVGTELKEASVIKSNILPINLAPLASFSGYFAFLIPQDIASNSDKYLTFQICTNRGKVIQNTFELYKDYLFR